MVTLGTKCPSITSTCSQSAAGATSPTCSASIPKSADNTEGAMRRSPVRPECRAWDADRRCCDSMPFLS